MELTPLLQRSDGKIVLVVADGLGGYRDAEHGSDLEAAKTPNLDRLAAEGSVGLVTSVPPGITPGSGPGHLALFGYDPQEYEVGRGLFSAVGLKIDLRPGDVAARANFCSLDEQGTVTDLRAGRIADDVAAPLADRLNAEIHIEGVEVFVRHEAAHRVVVVLRGEGLDPRVSDTDPGVVGKPPTEPEALAPEARRAAGVVAELDQQVRRILAGTCTDALLLRGFETHREVPSFAVRYGLRAAAVALYPMYRGVARVCGMAALPSPDGLGGQVAAMRDAWLDYDYFYMHHKQTDDAGHDGDRLGKVAAIEALDAAMPSIVALEPEVLLVTGDHATPTQLSAHSWHPVPLLMWGRRVGRDPVSMFDEGACLRGALGQRPSVDLMPLALAATGRLRQYRA